MFHNCTEPVLRDMYSNGGPGGNSRFKGIHFLHNWLLFIKDGKITSFNTLGFFCIQILWLALQQMFCYLLMCANIWLMMFSLDDQWRFTSFQYGGYVEDFPFCSHVNKYLMAMIISLNDVDDIPVVRVTMDTPRRK